MAQQPLNIIYITGKYTLHVATRAIYHVLSLLCLTIEKKTFNVLTYFFMIQCVFNMKLRTLFTSNLIKVKNDLHRRRVEGIHRGVHMWVPI